MARIGKTQHWVADQTGISRRRIQYLLVGSKTFAGEVQAVTLTYPPSNLPWSAWQRLVTCLTNPHHQP